MGIYAMNNAKQLEQQAAEILKLAEDAGVNENFLFVTTFDRYQTQLDILDKLQGEIQKNGVLVTKQYVRGTSNVYTAPAIKEYNRTADSANKTCALLLKIIKNFGADAESGDSDPLLSIINGDDAE